MHQLSREHLVLITTALPAFITMAGINAGDTVLDMKCDEGELLAEIAGTVGQSAASIVGLDSNRLNVETARSLLESKNLKQYIRLFIADLLNTDTNTITAALANQNLLTTFNVIFAVDTLPTSAARVTALRLLASRLTSTSGRLIVTFRHPDAAVGEVAGAVRFGGWQHNVHHRTSWMLESEPKYISRLIALRHGYSAVEA
jgi:2-polyprenyl-3-methyl-5-hydroxy-6-metoxy-1,4-benzoquinol methylase